MWLIALAWVITFLTAWFGFLIAAGKYTRTLDSKMAMLFWLAVVLWCLAMGVLAAIAMWQYSRKK